MHGVLGEIFGDYMEEREVMALTDYLMTTVGVQQGTVRTLLSVCSCSAA